jgi:hypothetical protein
MRTNGDERLRRLFAAARGAAPDTSRVEEGFEARAAARIREARRGAEGAPFGAWAWRLAPLFAGIVITFSVWTAATDPDPVPGTGPEIAAAWEAADLSDFLGGGE